MNPFYSDARVPQVLPPKPGDLDATVYFNDFLSGDYTAADWVITTTEAGAGSATEAIGDGVDGELVLTNAAGDNDADFLQLESESFRFVSGRQAWFAIRFKVDDATETDIVAGLQITDTTPLAVSDGVYFRKDDGDTNVDFVIIKDSTATTVTALTTLADDTYVELAFWYDGDDGIVPYVNGVAGAKQAITNMPDDEDLTVSFGVQNGAAAAKVMTIDRVYAAMLR